MSRTLNLFCLLWLGFVAGAGAETLSKEPSVSIIFVGDIMLDESPGKTIKRGQDPFAHFSKLLKTADIRIGNLECVVATTGSPEEGKPYTFRAHPRVLSVLQRHFDALSLANNHSGDFGPIAFGEMLDLLDQKKLAYFGGGQDLSKAHQPLIIERNGIRIALVGYNEFFPRSFEADFDKPGIAWSEDEQVQLDIKAARVIHHADLVIPFMHWGWEGEQVASTRQRTLAKLMIEAGADAVIGGHPHVVQDVEQYQGKPIIYSLGNFVFDGFTDRVNNTGWLLRLDADRTGVNAWRAFDAHIDSQGTPHPAKSRASMCWQKGQEQAIPCVK